MRHEAVDEHSLWVAADLDVRKKAVNRRIAQLRIAELLIAKPVFVRPGALGLLDGCAAFAGGCRVVFGCDARIGQHHLDPEVDGFLVRKPWRWLGKGHKLAAHPVRKQVDLRAVIHHPLRLGMDTVQVVDFIECIDPAFPVGRPVRAFVLYDMHLVDVVQGKMIAHLTQPFASGRYIVIHRNEDQSGHFLAANGFEIGAMTQDIGIECLFVGYGDILAVQREFPAVERTGELVSRTEIGQRNLAAAMRADIVMRPDPAIAVAHHDEGFGSDVISKPVPFLGYIADDTGQQPGAGEHLVPFRPPDRGIIISCRIIDFRTVVRPAAFLVEGVRGANMDVPIAKIECHQSLLAGALSAVFQSVDQALAKFCEEKNKHD